MNWRIVILGICGFIMTAIGASGLAFVVGELLWPSSNPVRSWKNRLTDQGPNVLFLLVLPGGIALLHVSLRDSRTGGKG